MKILIADDDNDIRKILRIYLLGEGFEVIEAKDGSEVLSLIDDSIDLVILDIMMPNMDGISACSAIREKYVMPILFLTAKAEDMDKIAGLTIGADDYITKPFNPLELIARVKSHIRRTTTYHKVQHTKVTAKNVLRINDIEIDRYGHIVKKDKEVLQLTKTEFGILELLCLNRGHVFNLVQIYENVWGEESILNAENTVSVHIKKLREKIEDNIKKPKYIKTVWGVGYRVD